jgi:hypothetical protein
MQYEWLEVSNTLYNTILTPQNAMKIATPDYLVSPHIPMSHR